MISVTVLTNMNTTTATRNSKNVSSTIVIEDISKIIPIHRLATESPARRNPSLVEIMKMCTDAYSEVADGQGLEIHWESKGVFDITEDDYFDMIEKKTAALIGLCCRVGAYLAGASEEEQKDRSCKS